MKQQMPELGAAIPGMGLTSELGSRPWQRPPEIVTLDQAVPFYMAAFLDKTFIHAYLNAIEGGMPVTAMADIMIKSAVMDGKHTIDVGMLVAPIVVESLLMIAERSGIDYDSGLEDVNDVTITPAAITRMLDKQFKSPNITEEQVEAREVMQEAVASMGKGLLSKRGKE